MTERKVTPLPKAKKRKTPKSQTLTKQADLIFSRIIRSRGVCEHCGRRENLQCAHGFSRRYRATRWDEEQCWCLCSSCHFTFTHNPLRWDDWMLDRMGVVLYQSKRDLALHGRNPDLSETVARLKAREAQITDDGAA